MMQSDIGLKVQDPKCKTKWQIIIFGPSFLTNMDRKGSLTVDQGLDPTN